MGLENYYFQFVEGYSRITAPLIDFLKKDQLQKWTNKCREAFSKMKCRVVLALVLKHIDFEGTFEVHTNASNFTIGGVLTNDGNPIAYESRKL